jgi:hypothetical protein
MEQTVVDPNITDSGLKVFLPDGQVGAVHLHAVTLLRDKRVAFTGQATTCQQGGKGIAKIRFQPLVFFKT